MGQVKTLIKTYFLTIRRIMTMSSKYHSFKLQVIDKSLFLLTTLQWLWGKEAFQTLISNKACSSSHKVWSCQCKRKASTLINFLVSTTCKIVEFKGFLINLQIDNLHLRRHSISCRIPWWTINFKYRLRTIITTTNSVVSSKVTLPFPHHRWTRIHLQQPQTKTSSVTFNSTITTRTITSHPIM